MNARGKTQGNVKYTREVTDQWTKDGDFFPVRLVCFSACTWQKRFCFRRTIADGRFYPSLFSLHPSRNRFMRLPCVALSLTRYSVIIDGLIAPAVFGAI